MGALPHRGWWTANESVCAVLFQPVRVSDGWEIVVESGWGRWTVTTRSGTATRRSWESGGTDDILLSIDRVQHYAHRWAPQLHRVVLLVLLCSIGV